MWCFYPIASRKQAIDDLVHMQSPLLPYAAHHNSDVTVSYRVAGIKNDTICSLSQCESRKQAKYDHRSFPRKKLRIMSVVGKSL